MPTCEDADGLEIGNRSIENRDGGSLTMRCELCKFHARCSTVAVFKQGKYRAISCPSDIEGTADFDAGIIRIGEVNSGEDDRGWRREE